jgi:hypothetical protein
MDRHARCPEETLPDLSAVVPARTTGRATAKADCQRARRQKTQASWRARNPGYATAHWIRQRNQDPAAEPVRTPPPLN